MKNAFSWFVIGIEINAIETATKTCSIEFSNIETRNLRFRTKTKIYEIHELFLVK